MKKQQKISFIYQLNMLFIFNTMLLKMLINATQNQRFFYGLKDIPISNFVIFFFQRVRKVLFAEAVLGVENKKFQNCLLQAT